MPHPATAPQYRNQPVIGSYFAEFGSIDSSNNYAIAQAHAGTACHGSVYFAHEQTAGKGQRGKKWLAAAGQNVMMSVLLNPLGLFVDQQFLLSASMALGCIDLLKKHLKNGLCIKWPNDLYISDRKAGGILIENIISGSSWKNAIVGIGININQTVFDPSLPNPISLKLVTGKEFDVIALAKDLCACLERRYQQLMSGQYEILMADYNNNLYKRKQRVGLKQGGLVLETEITNVDMQGFLNCSDEKVRRFGFGEVQWLL
ncbi:MAG: biotin--[acetyl-CoA-carboxylase] ligase [Bacteroidetes bacterium]|nr:biotin--[acetyl-CoA-carboxylase] ligase [Bacteroidota bacterium]